MLQMKIKRIALLGAGAVALVLTEIAIMQFWAVVRNMVELYRAGQL